MKSVKEIARSKGRDYITPEDITAAINAGADKATLQQEVLDVLGGEMGAEDWSCCAFVAARFEPACAHCGKTIDTEQNHFSSSGKRYCSFKCFDSGEEE